MSLVVLKRFQLALIVVITMGLATPALAEGSSPIFLNKIKNIFSRDSQQPVQKVAPMKNPNNRTVQQALQARKTGATTGQSLAEIKRQQWLARKAQTKQIVQRKNQQMSRERQQNLATVQQRLAQEALTGQVSTPIAPKAPTVGNPMVQKPAKPVRVIIPNQENENTGSKPIFKNYR